MFVDHCAGFDLKLLEHGIFPKLSGLVAGDIPACMYEVSGGVIGTVSNVFEAAAIIALRGERDCITRDDLSEAVRSWAIPQEIINWNPFIQGVGPLGLKR